MSTSMTVYVVTPDLERARRFYEQTLDIKGGAQSGNWVPFSLAGATFALHAAGPGNDDATRYSVSFTVDDIEATLKRFEGAGAKVLSGIADETFGRMATLEDPDGRTFEVVQYS